jgi:hypothetical protein
MKGKVLSGDDPPHFATGVIAAMRLIDLNFGQ